METLHFLFKTIALCLSFPAFFFLYPFLLNLIIYFSPLLLSTALCLLALHLFLRFKEKSHRGMPPIDGEKGYAVFQVCEEANRSFYDGRIRAGFLLLKAGRSRREEDGGTVFAGKVVAGSSAGAFVESVEYYEVDCLAEGLWDCYFGRISKWNFYGCD